VITGINDAIEDEELAVVLDDSSSMMISQSVGNLKFFRMCLDYDFGRGAS
jgi:hypothetical protein